MNTIWDIFLFFLFVADRSRNGDLRPEDVSFALGAGQQITFDKYWEAGAGKTRQSGSALLPFIVSQPLIADAAGLLTVPGNYGYPKLLYSGKPDGNLFRQFQPVTDDSLADALNSSLHPIAEYPRYKETAGGLQLYPARVTSLTLQYYKVPDTPVVGYTTPAADPVYNPAASVQLGFAKKFWLEIIHHSLPYIGVNLSSPELYALSKEFEPKIPA